MLPPLQDGACLVPHILVQLGDETILFKKRNELSRRLKAPFRMIPPYQGFRPRKPFLLYAVFGLEINFKLPLSQCRFHAFRYSLFPQQPAAQPVIIYGKIFSVLPLDAAGSQKSPVAHLVHRNSAVLNGINAPFHQHIFCIGKGIDPCRCLHEHLIGILTPALHQYGKLVSVKMTAYPLVPYLGLVKISHLPQQPVSRRKTEYIID